MNYSRPAANRIQQLVTVFSLFWLMAANGVGIFARYPSYLARMERPAGPTDIRTLDSLAYGLAALRMVQPSLLGLTLSGFLNHERNGGHWTLLVLSLWSLSLMIGGVNWLEGNTTGSSF